MRSLVLLTVLCLSACSSTPSKETIFSITPDQLAQLKLAYYSDYFSFIGWDEAGMVAFALDNNRGRDGDQWQAEHFVVLYDAQSGWHDLPGSGAYDNRARQLERIPDSPHFRFEGRPVDGMTIISPGNALRLETKPIPAVIDRSKGLSRYRMGSAVATLYWQGRIIEGRVIHEYLYLPAFNRLTRTYTGLFHDFHGIYAVLEGGNDSGGDLYLHSQQSDFLAALTGHDDGFMVLAGEVGALADLDIQVTGRRQALGLYRWPRGWSGSFTAQGEDYLFELHLEHQHNIANWIIGGFAMGIVSGRLEINGRQRSVVGLGELIL